MEIVREVAVGPKPLFSQYHLLMTLLLIREKGPVGRKNLSREMAIGEGSMRSILDRLKKAKYVITEKNGNVLAPPGRELLNKIGIEMFPIEGGILSLGETDAAVLVSHGRSRISDGFAQRDAAVRAGARGATTLVINAGRLSFPPDGRPLDDEYILDQFRRNSPRWPLREDDVMIIGTADDLIGAQKGALAAAVEIL